MTTLEFDDDIYWVPYSQLRVSDKNVRKKRDPKELQIPQLAAQIKAETLLQNLVTTFGEGGKFAMVNGKKTPKGPIEIVDGYRRYLSIGLNTSEMLIDLDPLVPVKIRPPDHAVSASLTAAFGQLPLHPVEQFDAFKALADEGKSVADIAAAFGLDERAVGQRLQLAKVAPPLLDAFRREEISLTALQAYAVSDDQERQLIVFKTNAGKYFHTEETRATNIRSLLTEKEVADTDPRVAFVGREAYQRAGGTVRADLFSTNEYLTDAAILQRLANEKVAELKARVEAEGWSWVDVKLSGFQSYDYQHHHPKIAPTTPAQDKELASINSAEQAIRSKLLRLRGTEPDKTEGQAYSAWKTAFTEIEVQLAPLATRREEIDNDRRSWGKKTLAECGAVLALQGDKLTVHRGLMDKKTAQRLDKAKQKAVKEKAEKENAAAVPDTLHENLTAHRSAVIRRCLSHPSNHHTALAVLLHSILPGAIGGRITVHNLTGMEGGDAAFEHVDAGVDADAFVSMLNMKLAADELRKDLPTKNAPLLAYLLEQSLPALMEMTAIAVAISFSAIHSTGGYHAKETAELTNLLVEHLDLDMRDYWQPTADSYFNHVSKELTVKAVSEAKGNAAAKGLAIMSKADAAAAAELHLENEDWLPAIFRRKADKAPKPVTARSITAKEVATKNTAAKKATALTKSQHVSQEEAVAHIQSLLEAKRQRDAQPVTDKTRPTVKAMPVKKAAVKKVVAKKGAKA